MKISIRVIATVITLWVVASLIFIFGFRMISWSGWEGGLPWLGGVVAMFWGVTQVSRALIEKH